MKLCGQVRALVALAPFSVILAACSPNDFGEVANAAGPVTHELHMDPPTHKGSFELPLHRETVRIGDAVAKLISMQPKNATELLEQSPLTGEKYKVVGWHADQETFAAIMLDDEMILGLVTIDKANQDLFNETSKALISSYGETTPPDDSMITYRFWENTTERLMMVYSPTSKGDHSMTIALGLIPAMDALGMSRKASIGDIRRAKDQLNGVDSIK